MDYHKRKNCSENKNIKKYDWKNYLKDLKIFVSKIYLVKIYMNKKLGTRIKYFK